VKVTKQHRDQIAEAIEATGFDNEEIRERYRRREIPRGHLVQDIDKRFRWDLYWAAKVGRLDESYTDAHLDTALRSIVKPL
jgi:hypothetical protein